MRTSRRTLNANKGLNSERMGLQWSCFPDIVLLQWSRLVFHVSRRETGFILASLAKSVGI